MYRNASCAARNAHSRDPGTLAPNWPGPRDPSAKMARTPNTSRVFFHPAHVGLAAVSAFPQPIARGPLLARVSDRPLRLGAPFRRFSTDRAFTCSFGPGRALCAATAATAFACVARLCLKSHAVGGRGRPGPPTPGRVGARPVSRGGSIPVIL